MAKPASISAVFTTSAAICPQVSVLGTGAPSPSSPPFVPKQLLLPNKQVALLLLSHANAPQVRRRPPWELTVPFFYTPALLFILTHFAGDACCLWSR
ncbi:hypothetical protein C2845_PM18G08780 [Panicum miliaceum]|uniref:Uncharacterized protein n=1 Tax=Panicum miliaceum TaxID=4540 RepID=A0A3L6PL00_PANMI|nr:hypothetical protein C2845_PM18G08780 [Panicum miliaceum]